MLPSEIATESVTRLRGTVSTDAYNNETFSWATPAELVVVGCSVQPLIGDEKLIGRDSVTSRWNLYAPPGADVTSFDRIRHHGQDYEIDGSVQEWTDTTGNGWDHMVAVLKLVEG